MLVALLGVLVAGAWGAYAVFAASAPPTPTLTSTPANPSNQASTSIAFSDSQSGVSFVCTLDGGSKPCSSVNGGGVTTGSASLPGLLNGSHTFSVSASAGGKTSSAASYTWTVDTTAPTVAPPALASSSPTNATSVAWTITFSESVKNVATSNFTLASSNLSGATIVGVSGSGAVYTVTANTGSLTNVTSNGSLGLNMTSKGTIADLAGNALSALPGSGATYTIDRVAPPAPSISSGPAQNSTVASSTATFGLADVETGVSYLCKLDSGSYTVCASPVTFSALADGSHALTVEAKDAAGNVSGPSTARTWTVDTTPPPKPTMVGPNNNSPSTSATFTFSDTEANVTWKCQMDGSGYTPCATPKTYTLLAAGTHVFDVEPIDAVGNVGAFNEWKWTISGLSGGGQSFTISISGTLPKLYPGGATDAMNLALSNPNSVPIYVTALTVTLSSVTKDPSVPVSLSCGTGDFSLSQLGAGANLSTNPITIPANGSTTLTGAGLSAYLPTIRMLDTHLKQDGCKNATLNFTFGGNAQS